GFELRDARLRCLERISESHAPILSTLRPPHEGRPAGVSHAPRGFAVTVQRGSSWIWLVTARWTDVEAGGDRAVRGAHRTPEPTRRARGVDEIRKSLEHDAPKTAAPDRDRARRLELAHERRGDLGGELTPPGDAAGL